MGQALYRKYRSKRLGEIVGQEHITSTLEKALATGRISHAYLLSGPRGVGKTSIARILAHEINKLPYDEDSAHIDIIEIDAASNNGVDHVRDLREKAYIAPAMAPYKVYIIDEVHMLSKAAFNALLKILEEPPTHVVFILATTEAHKLPETIISRTQHFTFKPIGREQVIDHLSQLAKAENIDITPEALALVAAHGGGSFRDSINLLDQASSIAGAIDETAVRRLLGIAPAEAIEQVIGNIAGGDALAVFSTLDDLYLSGIQASSIASQLAARIREALRDNQPVLPAAESLELMRQLIEIPAATNPERLLEITLMQAAGLSNLNAPVAPAVTPQVTTPTQAAPQPAKAATTSNPKTAAPAPAAPKPSEPAKAAAKPAAEPEPTPGPAPKPKKKTSGAPLDASVWPEVLNGIKKQYNTLYGVLRMAQPIFGDGEVELQLGFAFHQKRLNEAKNRKIIADFFREATGQEVNIICTVNKDAKPATPGAVKPASSSNNNPPLDTISNIFGGGELLK